MTISGNCVFYMRDTGFPELKKLIRDAFLTVSTDSAALHISKAEATPTIDQPQRSSTRN